MRIYWGQKAMTYYIYPVRRLCYSLIRIITEGETMKNPLESLHMTIVMGVVLTVIMVLVAQAIAV